MADQATLPHYFLTLYNAGLSVFPVPTLCKAPDKTTPWKVYQTDRAAIFDVIGWSESNNHQNIGIATGVVSGIFVLDIDNEECFETVKRTHGIPETVTVRTPRGYHFWYRYPGWSVRNKAGLHQIDATLPRGIDIRGDGGFTMAPGSYYVPTPADLLKGKKEGAYRFIPGHDLDHEIADAPEWLLELLKERPVPVVEYSDAPIPDAYAAAALKGEIEKVESAPRGTRNDHLFKAAAALGQLVGAGALDRFRVEQDLSAAASNVGQGKDEAKATIRSGIEKGMREPRQMPVREVETSQPSPPAPAPQSAPKAPVAAVSSFSGFRASDVLSIETTEQEWVIEDLIPRGYVTTIFGDGGVGKTLAAQTMASHIAAGEPFANRDVRKMRVAAIMCEDDANELNRRQRRINERLFDPEEVRDFHVISRVGEDNVMGILGNGKWEPTRLFLELREYVAIHGIEVVILDNIMQVFGGDINDNQQVTWFVNSLTGLAREMNGAVILLGHIAKTENSKFSGSMAWNNAVRSRLFLARDDDTSSGLDLRKLTVEKSNYGKTGTTIKMALFDGCLIDPDSIDDAEVAQKTNELLAAKMVIRTILEKHKSLSLSHQSEAYVRKREYLDIFRRSNVLNEKIIKQAVDEMLRDRVLRKSRQCYGDSNTKRERIVLATEKSANEKIDVILKGKQKEGVR